MRTELARQRFFVFAARDAHRLEAHLHGELHAEMAESAKPENRDHVDAAAPAAGGVRWRRRGHVPGWLAHNRSLIGRLRLTDSRTVTCEQAPEYQSVGDEKERDQDGRNAIGGAQLTRCVPESGTITLI